MRLVAVHFYCADDDLASLIAGYGALTAKKRKALREFLEGLIEG